MTGSGLTMGVWEQAAPIVELPASPVAEFTGWALADGAPVASVRLWRNEQVWASAVLGIERSDLLAALPDNEEANAGWRIRVNTSDLQVAETHRIRVEAMSSRGELLDLGSGELRIRGAGAPGTGLLSRATDASIVHLDTPTPGARIDVEMVKVRGWVSLDDESLDRVTIHVDDEEIGIARTFIPTEYVVASTNDPTLAFAGFEFVWRPDRRRATAMVRAVAHGTRGREASTPAHTVDLVQPVGVEPRPNVTLLTPALRKPRHKKADASLRILVATPSLGIGGGQLWLMDLLHNLKKVDGLHVDVIAIDDGLLRAELLRGDIKVHLTAGPPDGSAARYEGRVQELARVLLSKEYDVLLCNTISTFFIADAARRINLPYITAIHEHFDLGEWWPYPSRQIHGSYAFESLLQVLRGAPSLVFESTATRDFYRKMLGTDNGKVIYYGIDTAEIEQFKLARTRSASRRALNVPEDSKLVLNVGVFEPRKSQAMLIDSFARVADRHDEAQLILVGAGDDAYSRGIERLVSTSARLSKCISVAPVAKNIFDYYNAADLLVSASDSESMPRSFMEAIAFDIPIVTTDVAGCKELVLDGITGWTYSARSSSALEMALERALVSPEVWNTFAAAAQDLLSSRHSTARHSAEILGLLGAVAAHSGAKSTEPSADL